MFGGLAALVGFGEWVEVVILVVEDLNYSLLDEIELLHVASVSDDLLARSADSAVHADNKLV